MNFIFGLCSAGRPGQQNKMRWLVSLAMIFSFLILISPVFAAPPTNMPVFRAQLRVTTADKDDAQTDDYVKVDINEVTNRTWIESYLDDFSRGATQTYDLRLHYINTLSDLESLTIEKTGSDGWCVRKIELIINGRAIFVRDFGVNGRWLDNSGSSSRIFYISAAQMRAESAWINYTSPSKPYVTPRVDMRSRIDGVVGDFVAYHWLLEHDGGSGLLMHGPTVINTKNSSTWAVILDLEADNPFWNLDLKVGFDLKVTCLNGRPNFTTSNITINYPSSTDGADATRFVANDFPSRMNDMMKNFTYGQCSQMNIAVLSNGDLNISPNVLPPVVVF